MEDGAGPVPVDCSSTVPPLFHRPILHVRGRDSLAGPILRPGLISLPLNGTSNGPAGSPDSVFHFLRIFPGTTLVIPLVPSSLDRQIWPLDRFGHWIMTTLTILRSYYNNTPRPTLVLLFDS